jgi:hypothetical protein
MKAANGDAVSPHARAHTELDQQAHIPQQVRTCTETPWGTGGRRCHLDTRFRSQPRASDQTDRPRRTGIPGDDRPARRWLLCGGMRGQRLQQIFKVRRGDIRTEYEARLLMAVLADAADAQPDRATAQHSTQQSRFTSARRWRSRSRSQLAARVSQHSSRSPATAPGQQRAALTSPNRSARSTRQSRFTRARCWRTRSRFRSRRRFSQHKL